MESGVVGAEKLAPLRQECEELTAIFYPQASENFLIETRSLPATASLARTSLLSPQLMPVRLGHFVTAS